jgi:hypothetical protein
MTKKSVIQDERDAELRYQKALKDAKEQVRYLAEVAESDSRRIAAAETAAALDRIETAWIAAETMPPDRAKPGFWERVFGGQ